MTTKNKEFDRTFFKTHKSRSTEFAPNKKSGFTLIELLVVISIIALLSTVVLAAVNDGRVKARNTAKNSLVLEYVKALEMYRGDNGSYPISGDSESFPVCVGYSTTENCYGSSFMIGSLVINNALDNYLSGDFSHKISIISNNKDFRGVTYTSNDGVTYTIRWVLEKQISQCPDNLSSGDLGGIHTVCTYTLN